MIAPPRETEPRPGGPKPGVRFFFQCRYPLANGGYATMVLVYRGWNPDELSAEEYMEEVMDTADEWIKETLEYLEAEGLVQFRTEGPS